MHTWIRADDFIELLDNEIHLWRADLDQSASALQVLQQILAPDELAKARQFCFELDRARYILARGILRTILSCYLKTTAREPVFRYGPLGKPELSDGSLHFNISHSHDIALCAISRAPGLGIDVERLRSGVEHDLARCSSSSTRRFLNALPQPARQRAVIGGWTRMEAYTKALGQGLMRDDAGWELFLQLGSPAVFPTFDGVREQKRRCWLYDLSPRRGYIGALAAPLGRYRLRYWRWGVPGRGSQRRFEIGHVKSKTRIPR
jgi:4'-phosphopantetheinyl transferase